MRLIALLLVRSGSVLATASEDKTVRLWDSSGERQKPLKGHHGVLAVTFSKDGRFLLLAIATAY